MRKIEPIVHSPEKRGRIRTGRGFSLNELKEAKITPHDARIFKIPVDKRRRSTHPENVKMLNKILKTKKKPKKPKKKKEPRKKKVKKKKTTRKKKIKTRSKKKKTSKK